MLNKIWIFFGIFYLSLIPISLLYLKNYAHKSLFNKLILFNALAIAVYASGSELLKAHYPLENLFKPPAVHINQTTQGQSAFAEFLRERLPEDATGCIYWNGDMYTRYVIQEIYPSIFVPIKRGESTKECKYLISLDQPDPSLPPYPYLQYQKHFVYKLP